VSVLELSRWQFGITTVYHFLFVPITIGLGFLVAGFETAWIRTGNDKWLRLTKFYGRLFLINFAMGVVTGIVQEFQFGMNWSAYSRFVGDIFGAPLAVEALLAFFKVTCPVCQLTFPFLERLHQGTLKIYGISQNDVKDTREFNREFGVTFPTLLDPEDDDFEASNAFGISSVPTMFLVESDGAISRVMEGWSKREIEWLGGKAGVRPFRQGDNVPEWKPG